MNCKVFNDVIRIENPDAATERLIQARLSYVDKAKKFQVKRMENNPFYRYSQELANMRAQVNCQVYRRTDYGIEIPSGMVGALGDLCIDAWEDLREDTGEEIRLPWATAKVPTPRDYQNETVEKLAANHRAVASLATGLGKSLVIAFLIRRLHRKALVVVPNVSLANQFVAQLNDLFGSSRVGQFGDGKKQIRDVTVGIAASVKNRIADFAAHGLGTLIFDETHHISAPTVLDIANGLGKVGRTYGLSATPYRADGKDLLIEAACGPIVIDRDLRWGISQGWLAAPSFLIRKVKTGGYDYKDKLKAYKEHVLGSKPMTDRIVADAAAMIAAGKPTLVLVDMVEHGRQIAARLGVPLVTGADPESKAHIGEFDRGEHPGLVATEGTMGEGVDIRRIEVLSLANFAASKGLVTQCVGRAVRIYPGKKGALILDYSPEDSQILRRHALQRIGFYKKITSAVKLVD